ncbi:hypothetical protein [Pseudomonas sp. LRF_L74]|uniref:hypothetical protein n=1 Tax=Pseudomonas sp. LRF_L74 TaxID=3369422 RepID=UPI003F61ED5F
MAAIRRPESESVLTYRLVGVSAREEMVFKSIVGLLGGRTSQQWQVVETTEPDLLVIGFESADTLVPDIRAKVTFRRSTATGNDLQWPLRAGNVFEHLERAGEQILDLRQSRGREVAASFRLLRWPTQQLLRAHPGAVRLATLMASRPFAESELAQRSGCDLASCRRFLQAMEDSGFAERVESPRSEVVAIKEPVLKGLFARIRSRLGLPVTHSERE